MIIKYQGETLEYEVAVNDSDGTPSDLTGCTTIAGLLQGTSVKIITPTILGNLIKIKLTPTETAKMIGAYTLEIKLKDAASDIEVPVREEIHIKSSIIPNFV